MWIYYNPNPEGKHAGDCAIRAISKAIEKDWESVYLAVAMKGYVHHDMPSTNYIWGSYLRQNGFKRIPAPEDDTYTVSRFSKENPNGTFVVAVENHVVCVKDGNWYDTWDSGSLTPLYIWSKEE